MESIRINNHIYNENKNHEEKNNPFAIHKQYLDDSETYENSLKFKTENSEKNNSLEVEPNKNLLKSISFFPKKEIGYDFTNLVPNDNFSPSKKLKYYKKEYSDYSDGVLGPPRYYYKFTKQSNMKYLVLEYWDYERGFGFVGNRKHKR